MVYTSPYCFSLSLPCFCLPLTSSSYLFPIPIPHTPKPSWALLLPSLALSILLHLYFHLYFHISTRAFTRSTSTSTFAMLMGKLMGKLMAYAYELKFVCVGFALSALDGWLGVGCAECLSVLSCLVVLWTCVLFCLSVCCRLTCNCNINIGVWGLVLN